MSIKVIATNRKAYHNYTILDTFETGIALNGSEIKSIRDNRVSLVQSYVKPENGELWLINAHIARYEAASYMSHEPTRTRKLLMHRRQIADLVARVAEKGLTLLPLRLYLKDSIAKLEIGLARGKKQHDKREAIMERETEREIGRQLRKRG